MNTKFVTRFDVPQQVVFAREMKNYGVCRGARRFDDNSFALLKEDGVELYDNEGNLKEKGLLDVYVFKNGGVLKQKMRGMHVPQNMPNPKDCCTRLMHFILYQIPRASYVPRPKMHLQETQI